MSLTQSGSVSVNSDCNADILRAAKEEWLRTVKKLESIPHARDLLCN